MSYVFNRSSDNSSIFSFNVYYKLIFNDGFIFLIFSLSYVFIIGKGSKPWISLPKGKGVRLTIAEERDRRLAAKTQ